MGSLHPIFLVSQLVNRAPQQPLCARPALHRGAPWPASSHSPLRAVRQGRWGLREHREGPPAPSTGEGRSAGDFDEEGTFGIGS